MNKAAAEADLNEMQDEMSDVRRVIDEIDDELVALLAKRQRQIERAAKVKPALGIPARVPGVCHALRAVAARRFQAPRRRRQDGHEGDATHDPFGFGGRACLRKILQ